MTTLISIDGDTLIHTLDEHGWVQRKWTGPRGEICAHQAIRLCQPQPGDAYLVEQVAESLWGRGVGWNDELDTTEDEVRSWLAAGIEVTDADLEATFGPSWERVVAVVRQAAQLTSEQAKKLVAAWAVEKDAARAAENAATAAENAATAAARAVARAVADATRSAALIAVWDAAGAGIWDETWDEVGDEVGDAVVDAVVDAALAAVTWDLATEDGPYTIEMRDLLYAPWKQVFGELV